MSACGLDLINDSACGCLIEIRCGNLHAFLRKADGCGAADVPGRRSRNDGYLVPKSPHRLGLVVSISVLLKACGYSTFGGAASCSLILTIVYSGSAHILEYRCGIVDGSIDVGAANMQNTVGFISNLPKNCLRTVFNCLSSAVRLERLRPL